MMTPWHQVRRLVAAATAGIVAAVSERQGLSIWLAVPFGIAMAVIFARWVFPLVWRPPTGGSQDE